MKHEDIRKYMQSREGFKSQILVGVPQEQIRACPLKGTKLDPKLQDSINSELIISKTETKDSGDNKREGNNTEEKGGKIYTIEYLSILIKDHSPVKPLITTTDHKPKVLKRKTTNL